MRRRRKALEEADAAAAADRAWLFPAPGGFAPVVDGTYLPHHPFDPTAPAISRDKPLMVGTNKDEMAFFFWERKAERCIHADRRWVEVAPGEGVRRECGKDSDNLSQESPRRFAGRSLRCDYNRPRYVAWLH